MSDPRDDDRLRAAFDRLRHDAHEVDTMAARRNIEDGRRPAWLGFGLLGSAVAALLIVLGVAVFGGGDEEQVATQDPTPTVEEQGPESIDGTAWVLDHGRGPGGEITLVDGYPVTLTFDGANLGGTAACNGYGGTFTLDGDAITIADVAQTEMACVDPGVMDTEGAFLAALLDVDTLRLAGDELVLAGPATELVFAREAPVATAELVDQLWLLDTLIQAEIASSVGGEPATLLLRADGTVEGGTGCRTFTGDYVVTGPTVQFTSLAMDGSCTPDLEAQDSHVVTVLGDGFGAEIDGGRLTITSRGNIGLSYLAVDEAPDSTPEPDDAIGTLLDHLRRTDWMLAEARGPGGATIAERGSSTLSFGDGVLLASTPCASLTASIELDDGAAAITDIVETAVACDEADATASAALVDALGAVERAELVDELLRLSGPEFELVYEPAGRDLPDLTVGELLEQRPSGLVDVVGHLFWRGGSWLLCENLQESSPPQCGGRWVVVTNYDRELDPHTVEDVSAEDAAIAAANASADDALAVDGDVVYTTEPVTLTVTMVVDDRIALAAWPTDADLTPADDMVVAALIELFVPGEVGPDHPELSLSPDGVALGLGNEPLVTHSLAELADPAAWVIDQPGFNGFVGPFSVLETLAGAGDTTTIVGRHNHCAGPPLPVPPELREARQLSIQPTGIDSCIDWFAVDLFIDESGQVIAITLDLFGP